MNVKFTGKIIAAGQVQMGTSQNGTQWSSQEYVIEELNQQYPSRAVIQVYGSDKIQQFNIQVGEIITANIGLKAHQSRDGRWFNQLDCWKVERPNGQQQGAEEKECLFHRSFPSRTGIFLGPVYQPGRVKKRTFHPRLEFTSQKRYHKGVPSWWMAGKYIREK